MGECALQRGSSGLIEISNASKRYVIGNWSFSDKPRIELLNDMFAIQPFRYVFDIEVKRHIYELNRP